MKRNVLIFGLILGTILASGMLYMVNVVCNNPGMETNDALGYAVLLIIFSLVFFGIRNYRNRHLNGVISLGEAFKTGVWIAFLGSTIYVVVWLFYYHLFMPDFLDKFELHQIRAAMRDGATEAELADKREQMANFREMYKNPILIVLFTYFEVLPIGLVVAFVSALVLRKKGKSKVVAV